MNGGLRFGVLGALQIQADGGDVALAGPRQAKILAALLLAPNGVVSIGRLVSVAWDRDPPASAVRQVQDAISRIRRTLCDAGMPPDQLSSPYARGYRVLVGRGCLDLLDFAGDLKRAAHAAAAGDVEGELTALASGLGRWRGEALAGLESRILSQETFYWDSARSAAHRRLLGLEIAAGRHADVCDELVALTLRQRFDEQLVELAMVALRRSGRRAEALDVFHVMRGRLVRDLGLEPGDGLRRVQREILSDDDTWALGTRTGISRVADLSH